MISFGDELMCTVCIYVSATYLKNNDTFYLILLNIVKLMLSCIIDIVIPTDFFHFYSSVTAHRLVCERIPNLLRASMSEWR